MPLLLLALALSMDVFAVALSRGVTANSGSTIRTALVVGLALGAAQGLMPVLGWGLSTAVTTLFRDIDHWIAFVLLFAIGLHMLKEGYGRDRKHDGPGESNGGASLLVLALATSIDAAAAGATLAGLQQSVAVACATLAAAGFLFAVGGVVLGRAAGDAIGPRAQMVGGLVLIALALKIVIEHEFFGG
ncbi:MAG TPA: manganese efflux pump [Woeseiaceae bacterium]|nr:manganese efflux pump [Woeseiaceae bacterium]